MFGWLKEREVTAVITGERGDGTLTRYGIEEYVSDCVIILDHRVTEQTSTRRLRILKYRGSLHGTNEYPFLIGEAGVSVLPITSLGLRHTVSTERVSTGVGRLDAMLGNGGFWKGSTVLVSGTAGTGKSTLAAQFCDAACRRGDRAIYFAFEESEAEIVRNMTSVGINLRQWADSGLLQFRCFRPSLLGLESHLSRHAEVRGGIRSVGRGDGPCLRSFAHRHRGGGVRHAEPAGRLPQSKGRDRFVDQPEFRRTISQPTDHLARRHMAPGEDHGRQRGAQPHLVRSQVPGMAHSNQIREFLLTGQGIELADVYVGPQGVLTGSARQAQEAKERSDGTARLEDLEQRRGMTENPFCSASLSIRLPTRSMLCLFALTR